MTALVIDCPMAEYVGDRAHPTGEVTLNSSLAHLLLTRSPLHAWWHHPRLNPAWAQSEETRFDLGTALHAILLEGRHRDLEPLPFSDYRSKAAREARAAARASGKIPILLEDHAVIDTMRVSAFQALHDCADLRDCGPWDAETTLVWQSHDTWLRCRPDWIARDSRTVVSVKTTSASAEPDAYLRTLLGAGYEMQAAFECAAVEALTGQRPLYVWLVVETEAPYAASVLGLSPDLEAYARERMVYAVQAWARCLREQRWPGYSSRIAWLETPPWKRGDWTERLNREGL